MPIKVYQVVFRGRWPQYSQSYTLETESADEGTAALDSPTPLQAHHTTWRCIRTCRTCGLAGSRPRGPQEPKEAGRVCRTAAG